MDIDRLHPLLDRLAHPRTRWIIIGLHVVLLAVLFLHQGVLADKEALKYTGCARDVLHGDLHDLAGNYLKYASYVLFLLPFVAVGKASLAVVAQVLLGIVAADALARLTERITGNVGTGRSALALFLLCPLIQMWTLALYTEQFFLCLAILYLERVERSPRMGPAVVLTGLATLFARPVGMFFVVPALLWRVGGRWPSWSRAWLVPVGCTLLLVFAIHVPYVPAAQLRPIATGQVIAGVGGGEANGFSGHTIADAQRHLIDRTGLQGWCRITLRRALSLLTLTRPHYSALHNGVNTFFHLLYPLALAGLWRHWHDARVRIVAITLASNIMVVALAHDEWSGRFMVPLIPLIIILATAATCPARRVRTPVV